MNCGRLPRTTTIEGVFTPASITAPLVESGRGTLRVIDEHDPEPTHRLPAAAAVFAAVGVVLLFVIVQALATTGLILSGAQIDLEGELGVGDALRLSLVQVVGIAAALGMVVVGMATWHRIGLREPAGAARAGWYALLPVGLVMIAPTVGYVVATGGDLVHSDVQPLEAIAYVLLALLIATNEELWFRGLVVDVLGGSLRPWLVVFVSSVLFGLPHLGSGSAAALNAVAVMLAVGVPFAVVRLRYGSLLPLIGLHAVIDTWAFLHTSSVVAEGSPTAGEVAIGLLLPAALAAGYITWYRRSLQPPP